MNGQDNGGTVLDSVNPAAHHYWCRLDECVADDTNVIHQSVTSTVCTAAGPHAQVEVTTQEFFSADHDGRMKPVEDAPGAAVFLREHGHDGWDLTPTEARQLAQALLNHADLAAGEYLVSPLDRAATLVVSMLADTGSNVGELHSRVRDVLNSLVDTLAEVRR